MSALTAMNTRTPTAARSAQKGQVLVIFAGGLILLMAIAALVIDLGFVFQLRRQEQNAVDPGAVAAARYIRTGATPADGVPEMWQAACFYALENGFKPARTDNGQACDTSKAADGSSITVNYPPSVGAGMYAGTPGFVEVAITKPHQTFFARVLGIPSMTVTSSAVAAFNNGDSNSNSLIALDPGGCSGTSAGLVTGGGTVSIEPIAGAEGGNVHVNSSCGSGASASDDTCDNGQGALQVSGGGTLTTGGDVYIVGACQTSGGGSPSYVTADSIDEGSVIIGDPLAGLPPPSFGPPGAYCGVAGDPGVNQTTEAGAEGCNFNKKDTIYELSPGVYYGGWRINGSNVTLHLANGIYIMAGGGITLGASGTITSVEGGGGTPAPVMIFSTDDPQYAAACFAGTGTANQCQDKLNFTAGSDLLLRALDSGPYKGILIWQDGNGSGATAGPKLDVTLAGQNSLSLSGTIYDPRGVVTIDGGSIADGYAAVQIISWRWKIAGNGTLHMPYDPESLYQFQYKGLVK